jgi:hypothetical protein
MLSALQEMQIILETQQTEIDELRKSYSGSI